MCVCVCMCTHCTHVCMQALNMHMDMYMCYECLSIFLADTYIISLVHLTCLHPDQTQQTLL